MSLHTLMFGWEYPPKNEGGLGVACQGLVKGLLHHGTQVTLVLPSPVSSKEKNLTMLWPSSELMNMVHIQSDLRPYDDWQSFAQRQAGVTQGDSLYGPNLGQAVEQYTATAVELTKHVNPDVVHCHDWMTYEAGLRAGKHLRKPVVAHVHATELDRTNFHPNDWIARRERMSLLKCDKVIAVSGYTKNLLHAHYGIPNDKIAVVHNGHDHHAHDVQPARLTAQKHGPSGKTKPPLILFLGRLTVQKNPRQFLQIAELVHKRRPDVRFVMAGDGSMMPWLIDESCRMGLGENMIFAGKVSNREANALYAAADCFVMPSLSEPFGLVALEAIAHGTPVIVSKQSGVSEVLSHAFKVDYWDTALMADCLLTILREEPLARQLRAEAPKILQRLTWKNQASAVQSIYQDLTQS